MTNLYGFDTTNDVAFDKAGLPVGVYKAMAIAEEAAEKEGVITGVVVTYEVLDGTYKGKTGKVWYNTLHPSVQVANIAQQQLKRLGDATGKAISATAPIKGRVVTLEVAEQKKNPDYTEIKRYWPEDHVVTDAPF